jgi:hypothetical protein
MMRAAFAVIGLVPAAAMVHNHAAMLRTRGYTVVTQPVVTAEQIDNCAMLCHDTLERHLADVEAAGIDPIEQMYRFDSICHRQRRRWDLLLPREQSASWAALVDATLAAVTPIIREAQGPAFTKIVPLMSGAVVSRPGARVQRFHVDATHAHFEVARASPSVRIYNVFVPLVDISEDGDGTMFWPAPVLDESSRALAKHILDAPDSTLDASALDAPTTPAGGLVIFDYRTIHRGLANPEAGGRERPVAYVACATGGARDDHNFPQTSVRDISLERAQALPFWNRGNAAQDRLEYYTEIEGDDPFDLPQADLPRAAMPRTRDVGRRTAQPRMLSSSQNAGLEESNLEESRLEEERQAAREMHVAALEYSEATYHCNEAPSTCPAYSDVPDVSDVSDVLEWHCYSFPGAGSGLGADDTPPGGFGQDELARVSRGPLLSATACKSIIAEAEAVNAWETSPRVAHYARSAGCLTPLSALPKSLAMLSPFLASTLFPAIQRVRKDVSPTPPQNSAALCVMCTIQTAAGSHRACACRLSRAAAARPPSV